MFPISFSFEITKAIEFLSNFVEKFGKNEIIEIEEKELYNLSEVYSVFKKYREERVVKENPELKEAFEKMENFFREYIPGWDRERKSYILMRKSSTTFQNIISDFLKFKKEKSKELTFISSLDTGIEYEEFKEKPTEIEKDIVEAVSKLPGDIRTKYFSLVTLSSRIEQLYLEGRIEKAENIRNSIKSLYGEFGLRFSNLYQRGYLKTFMRLLKKEEPKNIVEKIKSFFDEAEFVFFIHKNMSISELEEIERKLEMALKNLNEYVALHSLGGATRIAREIIMKIRKRIPSEIMNQYTTIKKDEKTEYKIRINDKIMQIRDFSYIWYKNKRGRRMYRFFEGLM